jgi:hypothetical protein
VKEKPRQAYLRKWVPIQSTCIFVSYRSNILAWSHLLLIIICIIDTTGTDMIKLTEKSRKNLLQKIRCGVKKLI